MGETFYGGNKRKLGALRKPKWRADWSRWTMGHSYAWTAVTLPPSWVQPTIRCMA